MGKFFVVNFLPPGDGVRAFAVGDTTVFFFRCFGVDGSFNDFGV